MQKKYCICKENVEDKYIKEKYRKFQIIIVILQVNTELEHIACVP